MSGGMTGSGSAEKRDVFMDRLKRIEAGGPNTAGELLVGPATSAGPAPKLKKRRRRLKISNLFMLPFAAAIGILSMLTGRVAAFHMITPEGAAGQIVTSEALILLTDIGIAAFLLILLGWAFHLGSGLRRVAMVMGFLAVMVGEADMIERAPDLFAALFSPAYVADMLTASTRLGA